MSLDNHGADNLIAAVKSGNIQRVTALLVDPTLSTVQGNSAVPQEFYTAAYYKIMNILHFEKVNLLAIACENGDNEIAKLLLESGVNWGLDKKNPALSGIVAENDKGSPVLLVIAAEKKHSAIVELLLQHGADINKRDKQGRTALLVAAENGDTQLVELLLQHGADINKRDKQGRTALLVAAENGDTQLVELLLQHGADINKWDEQGRTVLLVAAENGYTQLVEWLLQRGASVSGEDIYGRTALLVASEKGHAKTVELLLNYKADIRGSHYDPDDDNDDDNDDDPDNDGNLDWPLKVAAEKGHVDVVRILLHRGGIVGDDADIAFWYAASNGHIEVVKLFLEFCNIDFDIIRGSVGYTPMQQAAHKGHDEVVDVIMAYKIQRGQRLNSDDIFVVLIQAIKNKNHDRIRSLLQHIDINKHDEDIGDGKAEYAPLVCAAETGDIEIVRLLLTLGAPIDRKDKEDRSALYVASEQGHLDIVMVLLEHNPDIESGTTHYPINIAIAHCHAEILRKLLHYGLYIDKRLADNAADGLTSYLNIAAKQGVLDSVKILVETIENDPSLAENYEDVDGLHGIIDHDSHGNSPLVSAASHGHYAVVEFLLAHSANVNQVDANNQTALTAAARNGHRAIVELLLAHKAMVNHINGSNQTALSYAVKQGTAETVLMLLNAEAKMPDALYADFCDTINKVLWRAAKNAHFDMVTFLIIHGAIVDITELEKYYINESEALKIMRLDDGLSAEEDEDISKEIEQCKNAIQYLEKIAIDAPRIRTEYFARYLMPYLQALVVVDTTQEISCFLPPEILFLISQRLIAARINEIGLKDSGLSPQNLSGKIIDGCISSLQEILQEKIRLRQSKVTSAAFIASRGDSNISPPIHKGYFFFSMHRTVDVNAVASSSSNIVTSTEMEDVIETSRQVFREHYSSRTEMPAIENSPNIFLSSASSDAVQKRKRSGKDEETKYSEKRRRMDVLDEWVVEPESDDMVYDDMVCEEEQDLKRKRDDNPAMR